MTEPTRPATWKVLKQIARRLEQSGVDYALLGGYALALHGFARATTDIDLLVEPSLSNSNRWIAALGQLPDRAALELANEPDVFAHDNRYAIRINDEITIDVMPSAAGLLKTKQGARPNDQLDAATLKAALDALARNQS
jgi:predicted transcriptional regulator